MRVVLAERRSPGRFSQLEELAALAGTLKYEVVAAIEQVREPDATYQIGRGKAKELAEVVKSKGAERVIFVNQLSASQAFKLSTLVGVEVIDKLQLILEIFAMRAGSPEAKLQVEYAKLSYELPRVRERVLALLSVERPGFRGGGEYEVKVQYDMIKRRMAILKRKLASVATARGQRRKLRRRRGFKLVALAGYTNAGKSTLLNTLTAGGAEVDDMLFTTLTPRTRAMRSGRKILLTDTVGFIDGLPPWLVEAFKATLEEIYLADLVVLIVDVAEPIQEVLRKLQTSREILSQYGVKIITALNKIDLLQRDELDRRLEMLDNVGAIVVPISASAKTNLGTLAEVIKTNVFGGCAFA